MNIKNKRAALEMSMGTIVTIVLVVVTLVLALILIRGIFSSGTNAVSNIDSAIQDQINQLFTSGNEKLVVYPNTNVITMKKGGSPEGFAFSVKNNDPTAATFNWEVKATSLHNCGSLSLTDAQNYLVSSSNSFSLGAGDISSAQGSRVLLDVPSSAPPCTITYTLNVSETPQGSSASQPFASQDVYIQIK